MDISRTGNGKPIDYFQDNWASMGITTIESEGGKPTSGHLNNSIGAKQFELDLFLFSSNRSSYCFVYIRCRVATSL